MRCALQSVDERRTAAIGYCFGGMVALELARSGAPVGAVASFHGLLSTSEPAEANSIAAKILIFTGAEDDLVLRDQIEASRKRDERGRGGLADCEICRRAKHGFTNQAHAARLERPGFGYSAQADRRSWAALRAFLGEVFDAA